MNFSMNQTREMISCTLITCILEVNLRPGLLVVEVVSWMHRQNLCPLTSAVYLHLRLIRLWDISSPIHSQASGCEEDSCGIRIPQYHIFSSGISCRSLSAEKPASESHLLNYSLRHAMGSFTNLLVIRFHPLGLSIQEFLSGMLNILVFSEKSPRML